MAKKLSVEEILAAARAEKSKGGPASPSPDAPSPAAEASAAEAAAALKITPEDLRQFKLIDEIVPEPEGGAHNDHAAMAQTLSRTLESQLRELERIPADKLVQLRYEKFRAMGAFAE